MNEHPAQSPVLVPSVFISTISRTRYSPSKTELRGHEMACYKTFQIPSAVAISLFPQ
jgi:hypothetical protein